jgi:hypothetical protein
MAGKMVRIGVSAPGVRAALLAENQARCLPPLERKDVEAIAQVAASWAPAPAWVVDPILFADDPGLCVAARRVLLVMTMYANAEGRCHPTYRTLEAWAGAPKNAMREITGELALRGRIEISKRNRYGSKYRVIEEAKHLPDPPSTHPLAGSVPPAGQESGRGVRPGRRSFT